MRNDAHVAVSAACVGGGRRALTLLFAPPAPPGIWLGLRLQGRLADKAFYEASWAVLFAAGCELIYDVVTA